MKSGEVGSVGRYLLDDNAVTDAKGGVHGGRRDEHDLLEGGPK